MNCWKQIPLLQGSHVVRVAALSLASAYSRSVAHLPRTLESPSRGCTSDCDFGRLFPS